MMPRLSKSILTTILVHILAWSVFGIGVFFYLPIFSGIDIHFSLWIRQVITFSLLVIAFYVNAFVLVPKILLKNHPGYYFAIIIGVVIAILILDGWNDQLLKLRQFLDEAFLKRVMTQVLAHRGENILQVFTLVTTVLVLGISTSLAAINKWRKDKQKHQELENDKITSELSFLKAQINPHFFFNTMNNIYVLTQANAVKAGEAIHQLSRMMRYLLYDTHEGKAMLSQEISFVKDYIDLMQLRLTKAVKVTLETPSNLQDMLMAPMILMPFLENAFKHGVSATHQSYVVIQILQCSSKLEINITNSLIKDNSNCLDNSNGIGLVNTRRRLELLYPDKHKLEILERTADNEYIVHLNLDLS